MARDYYAELGVDPSASTEEIKQAYRTLARKYHPDTNPGKETAARFTAVTEAYQTLTDSRRRLAYNQTLLSERQQVVSTAKAKAITKAELRAAFERVFAYAATAIVIILGSFCFARWLGGAPLSFAVNVIGPTVGIGLALGLMWGFDANFVTGDFVPPLALWVVRIIRFVLWIFGPRYIFQTLFIQVGLSHLGKTGTAITNKVELIAAGIGFLIAFIATLRDH